MLNSFGLAGLHKLNSKLSISRGPLRLAGGVLGGPENGTTEPDTMTGVLKSLPSVLKSLASMLSVLGCDVRGGHRVCC